MVFIEWHLPRRTWKGEPGEAGLKVSRDGASNVSGVLTVDSESPRIIVGSHIDTVPCAGTLDGTLGVVAGLECLRVIRESGIPFSRTVELIAFSDEEVGLVGCWDLNLSVA